MVMCPLQHSRACRFPVGFRKCLAALVASQAANLGPSPSAALDGGFRQNLLALRQTFGTGPDEIGVLYNGIEFRPGLEVPNEAETKALRQEVRVELAIPLDARLLMTTARLDKQKGHVDLFRSCQGSSTSSQTSSLFGQETEMSGKPLKHRLSSKTSKATSVSLVIAPISPACSARPIFLSFHHTSRAVARRRFGKQWHTDFRSSALMQVALQKSFATELTR